MNNEKLSIPGLQVTKINRHSPIKIIGGLLNFASWDGYLEEEVGFSKRKKSPSSTIKLIVDGGINENGSLDVSPGQVKAYWNLVDNEQAMKRVVLDGLSNYFPQLLADEYESYDKEEGGFPPLSEIAPGYDFKTFIRLDQITITEIEKDAAAYVQWKFSCTWDVEHGFQIITHKNRVIDIAQEYDPWKIYQDNGTYDEMMAEGQSSSNPAPYSWKKKWWQFWKKY